MDGKQYLTTVCWKTNIRDVVRLSASTYRVTVKPLDVNDPGALDAIEEGYYLQDTLGNRYSITAVDGYNITVNDDFELGYGPRMGRVGTVFQSVADGDSPFLSPARYENLDESARAKAYAIDLDILWRNSYQYWNLWGGNSAPYSVYGFLYNGYVIFSSSSIANEGWHIPTNIEFATLATFLGGEEVAGGKLKSTNTDYWASPNTGATNSSGFNAVGSGRKYNTSGLIEFKECSWYWTSSELTSSMYFVVSLQYNNAFFQTHLGVTESLAYKSDGCSIRLIKDSTTLTDGQTGTYVGNDGRIYSTICIGTQEWLAENLYETKYQNGQYVTVEQDVSLWEGRTDAFMCRYNDIELYPIKKKDTVRFIDTESISFEVRKVGETEYEVKANGANGLSGTENFIPKWLTDGVSLGDSPLYTLDGRVGLGLTVMDHMLDIAGVEGDNRPLRVRGSDGGGLIFGSLDSYTTWGALWSNDVTPDASNYTLATSHYGTEINMPTGASFIRFNVGGIEKLGMAASGGMWIGNGYSSNDPGAGKVIVENALGVKVTTPTAYLHLGAGTATAGTAPLKLTNGTPLYTKEDGALEYDSSHLWFTMGTTRYRLDQQGSSYTLPIASASVLGGIKVGTNLSIDGDGVLSAASGSYTLPTATASVLGGVKIGSGISITDGVISAPYSYSLPIASGGSLGGFKVGSGLSIDGSGILSTTYSYTLPTASATVLGGIKVGANLSITDGVLSAATSGGDMVWPSGGYGIPVYSGTTSWLASTLSPTGNGGKELKVNSAGDAFEFVAPLWTRGTDTVKILSPTTANDVLYVSTNTDYATIDGYNSHGTDGIAVKGQAVGGIGVAGYSADNFAGQFQVLKGTTNVLADVVEYSRVLASGTPANGLGGSLLHSLLSLRETIPTIGIGRFSYSWTDITVNHEYAKYSWSLIADGTIADKMELLGTGQLRLNKYGTGTPFAGTAVKYLAVNSSGYIIESAGTGDSGGILLGDLSATAPLNYDNTTGVFTHLLTDGNRHLPTGGSSNNGKFLMANTTDGLYTWNAVPGIVADGTVTGQLMYWTGTAWAGSSTGKLNWTESSSLLALGSVLVNGTSFQTRLYGGTTDAQLYGIALLRSASSISRPAGVRTLNLTRPDVCGVGQDPNGVTPSDNGYQLVLGRSPFLSDIIIGDGTYTDGAAGDTGNGLSNAYIRFPNYTEGTLITSAIGLIKSVSHGTAGKVWTSGGIGSDPTWETPKGLGIAGSEGKVWTSGGLGVDPTWESAPGAAPAVDGHVTVIGTTLVTGTGSVADMTGMTTSVTPKGSKILVLFSAPFRTSAVSQTFIVYINVDGSDVMESAINHYTNDSVISFHYLATVTPGATITVKMRWNAPTTITQVGGVRRTMTIIDLP